MLARRLTSILPAMTLAEAQCVLPSPPRRFDWVILPIAFKVMGHPLSRVPCAALQTGRQRRELAPLLLMAASRVPSHVVGQLCEECP
jgi:hypothetical protein